uniref:Retrovirus-related Pol polyprotein from transposon TNT 1-94 n=1 Tax=Tanacetum cinerariifolium TaxID=118510 RepID=A0A6L2JH29_TANCI|nr:retrovirus-related Pol polyprotein from transposon TNT 1-94 [Tanacetum cinerariifolium]
MMLEKKVNTKPVDCVVLNQLSQDFETRFVLQTELSAEQAFWSQNSVNSPEPNLSRRPTKVEVPKELLKVSMVNSSLKKLKHYLASFDVVVKERTTATAITEGTWGFKHTKSCFRNEIIPFVKALKDLFNSFDQYLVDELSEVQNVFHQMKQVVEQHRVESKTFKVKMNKVLNKNERLLEQVISKDIVNIIVNSSADNAYATVHECEKCLQLETELLNKNLQENVLVITALKDALRKLKRKALADDVVTSHSIILEILNVDVEPLNLRLLNNRKVWKPIRKVFTNIGYTWRPTGRTFHIVGNVFPLTRITSTTKVPSRKLIVVETDRPKPVATLVYSRKPIKSKSTDPVSKSKVVQIVLWYLDSDCSKHMTGDRSQFTNFINKFLGTVKFKNDHVAKILGYGDYQIGNVTILKASKTKSWLWHRRLSHLNFGVINHLARQCLVRGLPKLKFKKDHLCYAFAMGKSKKKPHKPKSEDTNQEKLYLLHMDLYGPIRVASINGKKYILVIVDDHSRFAWIKCLKSKDEAPDFIIKFLKMIQVRLQTPVRRIQTDNRTEFVNQTLHEYYKQVGISHETSVARSSHQNGVVKRRNRTLIKAARTMLIYAKALLFLWAEAVATACYTQNRSIVRLRHDKTLYELLYDKLPDLLFFHVFGALCYLTNDNENLGKLQPKADIGIFIGYAPTNKVFWIYNRRTRRIIETIHVDFDELTAMASEHSSLGPTLYEITLATISSGLVPNPPPSILFVPQSRTDWDMLFQPLFDELLTPSPSVDHPAPEVITPITKVVAPEPAASSGSNSTTTVDQDAPSPSNSQTTPDTQSSIIPNYVKKDNHDLDIAHMNNDPPVSTRLQLHEQALFCYYDAFLTSVEPKTYKDALTQSCWIEECKKSSMSLNALRDFKDLLLVQIYVDDIIFAASTPELCDLFAKITCSKFKMSMMGKISFFLGLQISQSPRGIFINQSKYALESLKKYGFYSCDPVDTPMVEKYKLDKDKEGKAVDPSHYRGMIDTILYLTASRPDLQFAICKCARYQAWPTEKHLHAVKKIFRYLRETVNRGLWYPKDSLIALTAFADADHAGCQDTRHSTSGSLQFLRDRLISWSSKRSKHIDIKYHFIKEHVKNGVIELYFVNTEYQLTDIFTKALRKERIEFLINKMGMRNFTPETLKQLTDEVEE